MMSSSRFIFLFEHDLFRATVPFFGIMLGNEACEMALHRDIFWIGREWAVTGSGMQAINQKHCGEFDIPIERLWDEDLSDAVCGQKWFNADDFDKGLAVARARYPQSLATPAPPKPVKAPPPSRPVPPQPVKALPQASAPVATPAVAAPPVIPVPDAPAIVPTESASEPAQPEKPAPSFSQMNLFGHSGKLLRVWRARRRR